MPATAAIEEPAVCGDKRTIVFDGQSHVKAIPKRKLMMERELQRVPNQRTHIEQAGCKLLHELKRSISVAGGNLVPASSLRDQAGEFSQEQIRGDQVDLS